MQLAQKSQCIQASSGSWGSSREHKQSLGLAKSSEASRTFSAIETIKMLPEKWYVKPADCIQFGRSVHGWCVLLYCILLIVCWLLGFLLYNVVHAFGPCPPATKDVSEAATKVRGQCCDSSYIAEADSWLQLRSEIGEEVWMPVTFFWCNRLEIRKFIFQRS